MEFLNDLKSRSELLYYFGWICLLFAVVCLILTKTSSIQVAGVNAWFKLFKFAASTFFYAWAMAWYCFYLPDFNTKIFVCTTIILLGFEIAYMTLQASRGQLSNFNISSSFYATMYSLMALAASAVSIYTAYVGWLFFKNEFPDLPTYYVWAIRFAIVLFVIFSFE